jgi:hypothetical protein
LLTQALLVQALLVQALLNQALPIEAWPVSRSSAGRTDGDTLPWHAAGKEFADPVAARRFDMP